MADTQIINAQAVGVPSDYVLPASVELTLKAISAEFDGSGTGVTWLPAVELYSDSGDLIARAIDQGASVAAAGSADVSWFPGVKASATAATTGLPPFAVVTGAGEVVTSGAAAETPVDFVASPFTNDYFATNDSSRFTIDTWTAAVPPAFVGHTGLGVHATGTYLCLFGGEIDDVSAPHFAGDPTTKLLFMEDQGNYTVPFSDVLLGSWYTFGHAEGGRNFWRFFWAQVIVVNGSTGTAPILLGAKQAVGNDLTAYPSLFIVDLDPSTFGF